MKKSEKTERTKERIIQAALQEFGTNGYDAFSINTLCNANGISKGLLYHNFKGKDELYLICITRCFTSLMNYLRQHAPETDLYEYVKLRYAYFSEHPIHARLFFEAILQPPPALAEEIRKCKSEFDQFNHQIYRATLAHRTLRKGVSEEDALKYFDMVQEMFNGYFSSPAYSGKDLKTIIADHEIWLVKMTDFMLYGMIERSSCS